MLLVRCHVSRDTILAAGSSDRLETIRAEQTARKASVRLITIPIESIVHDALCLSRVPCKMFKLAGVMSGDTNAINDLLNACRDEHQGLLFIKDAALPECSFIAIEAIWWSIEHCEDIETEQAGLNLFQVESATHPSQSLPPLVLVVVLTRVHSALHELRRSLPIRILPLLHCNGQEQEL